MVLKSNADILRFAKFVSVKSNVPLSTYCFGFYSALVRVVFDNGFFDNDSGLYTMYCTPSGLAAFLGDFPLKRFSFFLSQLARCGLIVYEPNVVVADDLVCGKKPFKRSKPLKLAIDLTDLLE